MNNTVLVAGGTGNLGGRIINYLLAKGADVRMLVRYNSNPANSEKLFEAGVRMVQVDMLDVDQLTEVCRDVSCVVSALQGLGDVILGVQTALLKAAVAAGVPRFIPSDYSVDFTNLQAGENRNFDLRRDFHHHLDSTSIQATSIYNGAFTDILSYNIPVLDTKKKMVGYWGDDPDWKLDFTTMDNTAEYTAFAALDTSAPRSLQIASFRISPKELAALASEKTNEQFNLVRLGSIEEFAAANKQQRAANPEGEKEVYPRWQQAQYMRDMFETHHSKLDNDRYSISWTSAETFLGSILK